MPPKPFFPLFFPMKNSLLLLAGAAALSLASCSQTKTSDTTTTTVPADGAAGAAASAPVSGATYEARAQRVADKFAADMKINDEATRTKLRAAYLSRSKRYGALRDKYRTDTTGMAAAMRQYTTDTDTEFKGVLTSPEQYQSYQSSRATYDEANNMDDTSTGSTGSMGGTGTSAPMTTDNAGSDAAGTTTGSDATSADAGTGAAGTAAADGGAMSGDDGMVGKSKAKMADGSKVKVKTDGKVKIKDADGNKVKL